MTNDERSPKPECRKALWCAMANSSFGFRYSFGFRHSAFGFENGRSWKAPFRLFSARIGTMNPLTAWSSGFSRSGDAQPPKGGTPYQRRFMESPLGMFAVHWDHEPAPADPGAPASLLARRRRSQAKLMERAFRKSKRILYNPPSRFSSDSSQPRPQNCSRVFPARC